MNESTDNIGLPTYTSSPIQINQTQSSSTTKKRQGKNKKDSHTSKNSEPLRVLTINFQSIKNKKPEIELIIESCKPSIIFGTETWLYVGNPILSVLSFSESLLISNSE
jgi:hypothetical protein